MNNYILNNGLGVVSGNNIPELYLKPMSKFEIDSFIDKEWKLGKNSQYFIEECRTGWAGTSAPCFDAVLLLERYNLYFVNDLIPYGEDTRALNYKGSLMWAYKEAKNILESMPVFPGLKQQLKNMATFAVSAVAGFFSAGPVGIFTGGAAAIKKVINDERIRRGIVSNKLIQQNSVLHNFSNTEIQIDRVIEALKTFFSDKRTIVGIASIAVVATGFWMLGDKK